MQHQGGKGGGEIKHVKKAVGIGFRNKYERRDLSMKICQPCMLGQKQSLYDL